MSVTLCAMIQSPEKEVIRAEKLPVRMTSIFRCSSDPLVNICISLNNASDALLFQFNRPLFSIIFFFSNQIEL